MNKKIKTIILIFIIFLGIFILFNNKSQIIEFRNEIKKKLYGNPIDINTGIINNMYFEINSNGKNANKTTRGICEAIEYASNNNIEYIKLDKGQYLVNGEGERYKKKGIVLKSNMILDLNNSSIIHEKNSSERYTIINLYDVENVTICNGIIIGDKNIHDYNTIKSTHQWGYGIEINGSQNIQIYNVQVKDMTGDGIVLSNAYINGNFKLCNNIEIKNNCISNCRRQGITITSGKNIDIYQNEIYGIYGNAPQSGIDLESDFNSDSIENIKICENVFYDFGSTLAIQLCWNIKNVEISNNNITGRIVCYNCNEKLNIINNVISNGTIELDNRYNTKIDKVNILDNKITNSIIKLKNGEEVYIKNNKLQNTNIEKNILNVKEENNIIEK